MKKVFFTGHRNFVKFKDTVRLDDIIEYSDNLRGLIKILYKLASEGTTDFYSGGALGWDLVCATIIIVLRKKQFPAVKLHLVLPCPPEEQTTRWNIYEKEYYKEILEAADSVEIVSNHYDKNCMKKRNERLVELGDVCICYYDEKRKRSGTGQTVRLAEKNGREIIRSPRKLINSFKINNSTD